MNAIAIASCRSGKTRDQREDKENQDNK